MSSAAEISKSTLFLRAEPTCRHLTRSKVASLRRGAASAAPRRRDMHPRLRRRPLALCRSPLAPLFPGCSRGCNAAVGTGTPGTASGPASCYVLPTMPRTPTRLVPYAAAATNWNDTAVDCPEVVAEHTIPRRTPSCRRRATTSCDIVFVSSMLLLAAAVLVFFWAPWGLEGDAVTRALNGYESSMRATVKKARRVCTGK